MAKIYKHIFRFIEWLLLSLILLSGFLFLFIQIPIVKKEIAVFAKNQIVKLSNHRIEFSEIELSWFDEIELKDVKIYDFRDSIMIDVPLLNVNYFLPDLINQSDIILSEVRLTDASLFLRKYDSISSINITEFANSFKSNNADSSTSKALFIGKINFNSLDFSYSDATRDSITDERFDYNHFSLMLDSIETEYFYLFKDSINIKVNQLSGLDRNTDLRIESLTCEFALDSKAMSFSNLNLETPFSNINDEITLNYNSLNNLSDFVNLVSLDISTYNSYVGPQDIALFSPRGTIPEIFYFDLKTKGTISSFRIEQMNLRTSLGSSLTGSGFIDGLPDLDNTFFDLSFSDSEFTNQDINRYLKSDTFEIEHVRFSGDIQGFISDFVANGDFAVAEGFISSDINLKNINSSKKIIYDGQLEIKDLDISNIIPNPYLGRVNFNGNIKGQGITPESANLFLEAKLANSEIYGTTYELIVANGILSSQFFSGSITVKDTLLDVEASGTVDFKSNIEQIDFKLDINHADLYGLNISKTPLEIQSRLSADLQNSNLDSMQGIVEFFDTKLWNIDNEEEFDSFKFIANTEDPNDKSYSVLASGIKAELTGDFNFTDIIKDVPSSVKEYIQLFTKELDSVRSYYTDLEIDSDKQYYANLVVEANSIKPYLEILESPVFISDSTTIELSYKYRKSTSISLYTEIDSIIFGDRIFTENLIDINATKEIDTTGILAVAIIESKDQKWDLLSETEELFTEIVWYNNKINADFSLNQKDTQNRLSTHSILSFSIDSILVHFTNFELFAFSGFWNLNDQNQVIIKPGYAKFDNFNLNQNEQYFSLGGEVSDTLLTDLEFEFREFDLINFSVILPGEYNGILNAKSKLLRYKATEPIEFISNIKIDSLVYDDYLIGNFSGSTTWDNTYKSLNLSFLMEREGIQTLDIFGTLTPRQNISNIDMKIDMTDASLKLIQPFLQTVFTNINGEVNGTFDLCGTLQKPELYGAADITNGVASVGYLNTDYSFEGPVNITPEFIRFQNVRILDRFNHQATLNGQIEHEYFKNFNLDMGMSFSNFELLNTNSKDNSYYYGRIYGDGNISLKGVTEDLIIDTELSTRANTKLYLPIGNTSEVLQSEFIDFVNLKSKDTEEVLDVKKYTGIRINMQVNVTDEAYVEMIFDPRTGDIIRGNGNGNLQLTINREGDVELFGGIEISKGAYNFTSSFINKEFNIRSGSTINWFGDPYDGILNIEATYRQLASLADYQPDLYSSPAQSDGTQPEQSVNRANTQRQPVLVVLKLVGPMLSPTIDFSLELENQVVDPEWNRVIQSINSDSNAEELKRQVFSLLMLRRFSPQQSFAVGNSDFIESSVSEFVSNQLSYWLSQVDDNLEVSFDLASMDDNTFNTFQLRLAYTFLDGRLRVTRWGNLVPEATSSSVANIVGNWQVEYILTEDGKLRARAFTREQQLSANQSQGVYETGLSIQHVTSFNEFSDLIKNKRKEAIRRKEEESKTENMD
jgi:hypothetical protein